MVVDDLVRNHSGRDLARPTDYLRHPERAFPVRVLFAAERCHSAVWPTVHMRAVVGRVHDDRVVCDPELVQLVQERAHDFVVVDHRVVVLRLPAASLTDTLRLGCVRKCMCVVLNQRKNGVSAADCRSMKSSACSKISSSTVSMRFLVSGPVSTTRCLPTRPQRGSS